MTENENPNFIYYIENIIKLYLPKMDFTLPFFKDLRIRVPIQSHTHRIFSSHDFLILHLSVVN